MPPISSAKQSRNAKKQWAGVEPSERSENMRALAHRRWMANDEEMEATREHFETADLDGALEELYQLRKVYEMVMKILDGRVQATREEKCSNPQCTNGPGGTPKKFDRNTPWHYRNAERDPVTGAAFNVFACCPACMVAVKSVLTHRDQQRRFA
jgi:hypothetical protein